MVRKRIVAIEACVLLLVAIACPVMAAGRGDAYYYAPYSVSLECTEYVEQSGNPTPSEIMALDLDGLYSMALGTTSVEYYDDSGNIADVYMHTSDDVCGSQIDPQWRYSTHWAGRAYDVYCLDPEDRLPGLYVSCVRSDCIVLVSIKGFQMRYEGNPNDGSFSIVTEPFSYGGAVEVSANTGYDITQVLPSHPHGVVCRVVQSISFDVLPAGADIYVDSLVVGFDQYSLYEYNELRSMGWDFIPYEYQATIVPPSDIEVDFVGWLTTSVGGFFGFEIVPGFSIGTILTALIGVGLVVAFLKYFAGG